MDFKKLEEELGIANLSEQNVDEINKEVEDLISLLNETENGMISLEEVEEESLEELIQRDNETELEDIDTDLINDISIYDPERRELSEKEKEQIEDFEQILNDDEPEEEMVETISFEDFIEESEKKPEYSNTIIYSIIGFLLLSIAIVSIFFIFAFKKVNQINLEKQIEKENKEVKAKFMPEENNSAYLGIADKINDTDITLEKISVDSKYIKLYINSKMDSSKYDFILTDIESKLYPVDINFIKQNDSNIEIKFYSNGFISNEYNLVVKSIETGEIVEFNFTLPKIENDIKIKYLNNIISKKGDDFYLNITGGDFTSSGSSIYYTLEPEKDTNFEIQQGFLNKDDLITVKENNKKLEPLSSKVLSAKLENGKILGRMDFEKVRKYDSNLTVSFNNIYKKYNINKTINLSQLNSKQEDGGIEFKFDKYKLFIEGMHNFDDLFVLVLHGEDTTILTENRAKDFNHIEILLNAEIVLTTASGMEIILKPNDFKSSNIGTDIIFKFSEAEKSLIQNLSPENIKINVDSALIKTDDIYIPISLSRAMDRKVTMDKIMDEQIKKAFNSRLDYKYHSKNNIKGFSQNVLNDSTLMQEYQPVEQKKNPNYEVVILTEKLENNELYALVQEIEKYNLNEQEYISYKTHKIKAIYQDEKWTIIQDEVVK